MSIAETTIEELQEWAKKKERRKILNVGQQTFGVAGTMDGVRMVGQYANDLLIALISTERDGTFKLSACIKQGATGLDVPDPKAVEAVVRKRATENKLSAEDVKDVDMGGAGFAKICPTYAAKAAASIPTTPAATSAQPAATAHMDDEALENFLKRRSDFLSKEIRKLEDTEFVTSLLASEKANRNRGAVVTLLEQRLGDLTPSEDPNEIDETPLEVLEARPRLREEAPSDLTADSPGLAVIHNKVLAIAEGTAVLMERTNNIERVVENQDGALVVLRVGLRGIVGLLTTLLKGLNDLQATFDPHAEELQVPDEVMADLGTLFGVHEGCKAPETLGMKEEAGSPQVPAPVEPPAREPQPEPAAPGTAVSYTDADLEGMTMEQLQDLGEQLGIADARRRTWKKGLINAIKARAT